MNDYEWCRWHIDNFSIWRSSLGEKLIGKNPKEKYTWQFYLRRSLLDPEFFNKIGDLFYEKLKEDFLVEPFQICACETAGVPIGLAVQQAFYRKGHKVNTFAFRKDKKAYGLFNTTEGKVKKLPILLIDDLAGSQVTMLNSGQWLLEKGFKLFPKYAAVIDKKGRAYKKPDLLKPYLNSSLISLYDLDDFRLTKNEFVMSYGKPPPLFEQP